MDLTQVVGLLLLGVTIVFLVMFTMAVVFYLIVDRDIGLEWGVLIAVTAFSFVVICGYLYKWKWTGLPNRTFWDWLKLLIVPAVLAIGGYLFNRAETQATQAVAEQRAQDDALQANLDNMSSILIGNKDESSLYEAPPTASGPWHGRGH